MLGAGGDDTLEGGAGHDVAWYEFYAGTADPPWMKPVAG
jgi:hypothetical protein